MRSFCITADCAPVAQLDRALPSGGRGHRFESYRVRQNKQPPIWRFFVLCTRGLEPTFEKSAGQPILTSCKRRPKGEVQEAPNQSYRVRQNTAVFPRQLRLSYATFCSNICGVRYGIITFLLLSAAAVNAAMR
jgi:hypothetical protein